MPPNKTITTDSRQVVFKLLLKHKRLSRQQLSDITGLHRSTLSRMISRLIEEGVICEAGMRPDNTGGKPQTWLALGEGLGRVMGIRVERAFFYVVITDLNGSFVEESLHPVPEKIELFSQACIEQINQASSKDSVYGPLRGVCIGVPGVVDCGQGMLTLSYYFNVRNFPLKAHIERSVAVPVWLENHTHLACAAEIANSSCPDNFLYLAINHSDTGDGETVQLSSFGSSLVINGKIYRGSHYTAGEVVDLIPRYIPDLPKLTPEEVESITSPKAPVNSKLMLFSQQLGQLLCSISLFLDIESIIIGGTLPWFNTELLKKIDEKVNSPLQGHFAGKPVEIITSTLSHRSRALGAVRHVLERLTLEELLRQK